MAFYVRDNCVRCDKRFPFACGLGDKSETGSERAGQFVRGLWLNAAGRRIGGAGDNLCGGRYWNGPESRRWYGADRPGCLAISIQQLDRGEGTA